MTTPRVSFVLATWNRRDVVLKTLDRIAACGLPRSEYEIIVVDNHSTDGTAAALTATGAADVIELDRNLGSCAKAVGASRARAPFTMFLDDDSWPRAGCISRMLAAFEERPRLAAAGFCVHLPGGGQECSALPHVFVGCGVGLRTAALAQLGGLDPTFFMQAEEYDLSFRLLAAGWQVETFSDLHVDHDKTQQSRRAARPTYFDTRNNLRIVGRHLSDAVAGIYWQDWTQRYRWLAQAHRHSRAFHRGLHSGMALAMRERLSGRFERLGEEAFEAVFRWREIREHMNRLAAWGVRRISLVDLGKNVYPFVRAAAEQGIRILALGDDRFARPGRTYRGVPVVPLRDALETRAQAFVVSNTSYVHARQRWVEVSSRTSRPVFSWFDPPSTPCLPAAHAVPMYQV